MLTIALYTACFPGLKSIKNFGPPSLRFGHSTANALAPALTSHQVCFWNTAV